MSWDVFKRHPKFSHGQFGSIEPIRQTPKFLNQLEVTRSGSSNIARYWCLVPPKNPENGETGDGQGWGEARVALHLLLQSWQQVDGPLPLGILLTCTNSGTICNDIAFQAPIKVRVQNLHQCVRVWRSCRSSSMPIIGMIPMATMIIIIGAILKDLSRGFLYFSL